MDSSIPEDLIPSLPKRKKVEGYSSSTDKDREDPATKSQVTGSTGCLLPEDVPCLGSDSGPNDGSIPL